MYLNETCLAFHALMSMPFDPIACVLGFGTAILAGVSLFLAAL